MVAIERFFQFLEFKKLKHTPIEKEIGLSNGYLGKMLTRKASIGSEVIEKIVYHFPDLNLRWLITGVGEMVETKDTLIINAHLNCTPECTPECTPAPKAAEAEIKYKCVGCMEKSKELSACAERMEEYKERIQELKECIASKNILLASQEAEIKRISGGNESIINQSYAS